METGRPDFWNWYKIIWVDIAYFCDISYELNTDFDIARMTPQEQAQLIASWQAEAIDHDEMRGPFKRGGVAYQQDKEGQDNNAQAREDLLGVRSLGGRLAPDPAIDPKTGLPREIQQPSTK